MPEQASVQSIRSIAEFRVSLCIFVEKAKQAVSGASHEVRMMRVWLDEQAGYWGREHQRRSVALSKALAELQQAKLSSFQGGSGGEERKLSNAKQALQESLMKRRTIKNWKSQFDGQVSGCLAHLGRLSSQLEEELPQGIAYLQETLRILHDYTSVKSDFAANNVPEQEVLGNEEGELE